MAGVPISRRAALETAAGALFAWGERLHAREKAMAFALIGDRYHNSDYIRIGLGRTIGREAGVSIDFCDEVKMLDAEALAGRKLLIMLRDGMLWPDGYEDESSNAAWVGERTPRLVSVPPVPKVKTREQYWITAEQGKAVREFIERGGAGLFFHNVTYISPHNADFRDVLGAVTEDHPPIRKFKVRVVNREHPITRGVSDFVVTDEQHFVRYEKNPQHLLLESENEDGLTWKNLGTKSAAGWA